MAGYICGFYYTIPSSNPWAYPSKIYIPQVSLESHTTILSTTSRTKLTQTFVNPSEKKGIKEIRYTFPLYDGVSVVGFTCRVGNRVILGQVKEKEKAKKVFEEAVAQGQTAGLLEQLPEASDVFTTSIGNIPAGAELIVEITYLGELKHDAEVDGVRFTIPTVIAPRYGNYPGELAGGLTKTTNGKGIQITVDAEMAEGSFIQQMRSPSHPIAVTMGTTSVAPNLEPQMYRGSATLSLGSAELDTDFVLQIVAKDAQVPKAILETHPTIPNQRALMATLVPKFSLPPGKPEIVFICDRSGSMAGSRITSAVSALKIFLKSLPIGVKFNICSFGSSYSFLWKKSKSYSQSSLDEAVKHVQSFQANFGGTEMYQPMKAAIDQRFKDIPLEIMLLTDGEIWDQQTLFSYLNKEVIESKAPIRVFTLGIGNGVSHALIEGVARAGNGFSQAVGEGEKMDSKVVRMLKGSLTPHINDYTLEVKFEAEDDDFEIVEKVTDNLRVKLNITDKEMKANEEKKKPISLFDTSVDLDKEEPAAADDDSGEARYAHLPTLAFPNLLQAPHIIPSLFPFNRTTVYLLIGPESTQKRPKSVILRGTSAHGPLELEIPIQVQEAPSETIHQLAAKKAIAELEQGRGWITQAKDEFGKLIKEKFESCFEDMMEREAVRLGVQFQVGGKWCSFVAVESNNRDDDSMTEVEWLDVPTAAEQQRRGKNIAESQARGGLFGGFRGRGSHKKTRGIRAPAAQRNPASLITFGSSAPAPGAPPTMAPSAYPGFGAYQGPAPPLPPAARMSSVGALGGPRTQSTAFGVGGGAVFGASAALAPAQPSLFGQQQRASSTAAFGMPTQPSLALPQVQATGFLPDAAQNSQSFGSPAPTIHPFYSLAKPRALTYEDDSSDGAELVSDLSAVLERGERLDTLTDKSASLSSQSKMFSKPVSKQQLKFGGLFGGRAKSANISRKEEQAKEKKSIPSGPKLDVLIELQTFEGFWEWDAALFAVISVSEKQAEQVEAQIGYGKQAVATALAVVFFERKLKSEKDAWELVVEKARGWLESNIGEDGVHTLMEKVVALVG